MERRRVGEGVDYPPGEVGGTYLEYTVRSKNACSGLANTARRAGDERGLAGNVYFMDDTEEGIEILLGNAHDSPQWPHPTL